MNLWFFKSKKPNTMSPAGENRPDQKKKDLSALRWDRHTPKNLHSLSQEELRILVTEKVRKVELDSKGKPMHRLSNSERKKLAALGMIELGCEAWYQVARRWIQACSEERDDGKRFNFVKGAYFGLHAFHPLRETEIETEALAAFLKELKHPDNAKQRRGAHHLAFSTDNHTVPGSEGRTMAIDHWQKVFRPFMLATRDPDVARDALQMCTYQAERRAKAADDDANVSRWSRLCQPS